MPAVVGENGFHEVEVESKSDAIKGDSITIEYHPAGLGSVVQGASVIGVQEGSNMVFKTDLEGKNISPGIYWAEFIRDDNGTNRQIGVTNSDDNQVKVRITDADSI